MAFLLSKCLIQSTFIAQKNETMRNLIVILSLIFSTSSLQAQQYNIALEIKGAKNMNAQFAYYQSDKQYVVQNGKFDNKGKLVFKGNKNLQHGIYFVVVGNDFFDILIRDNQNFKLKTDTSNLVLSMKVTGSEENKIFFDYQKDVYKLKVKIDTLNNRIKAAANDSATIAKYKADVEELQEKLSKVPDELEKKYPDSYIVKIINAMGASSDDFDFADEELLLTPFYYNKVRLFIKKSIEKHYSYINFEIRKLLNSIRHSKANFEFVANYLLNFYNTFYKTGINRVFIFIADNYFLPDKAYWFTKEQLKQVKKRRDFLAQSTPGHPAQDLTLESTSGEYFSLLQTEAKLTFLYFWSANCGHCTKATKILKKYYEKLKKNGIEIFAVNIDDNKRKWLDKVEELQTEWINCYDPEEASDYRAKYYVFGSPLLYVINADKKIVKIANGEIEIEELVKKSAE